MADEDGPRQPLEVLRNAARGGQERFLVALGDGVERPRITGALNSEGFVLEVGSVPEGLARLADESFDLAILDLPDAELQSAPSARDPLAAWREMRPFTDLVLIGDGDPTRAGQAFAREVAAVLPKPLPEVDALLRAHVKRLAGFRRARTRGLLVMNAYGGIKDQLAGEAPELGITLDALVKESKRDPTIIVLGDGKLAEAAGTQRDDANADVTVVSFRAVDAPDVDLAGVGGQHHLGRAHRPLRAQPRRAHQQLLARRGVDPHGRSVHRPPRPRASRHH
jgi:CheY-like chemotaxis protein